MSPFLTLWPSTGNLPAALHLSRCRGGEQGFAVGAAAHRAGRGDGSAQRLFRHLGGGEIDLPLLLLGEANTPLVMLSGHGIGALAVGIDGDRAKQVAHGVLRGGDFDGHFPFAGLLGQGFWPEDTGLGRCVGREYLVRLAAAGENDADLGNGQRLEIGQAGQVGGEGRFFAGDEAWELDEEFGLVGEVGDFFTAGAMRMLGLSWRWMAAVLGMWDGRPRRRRSDSSAIAQKVAIRVLFIR
jgi:hypothetical protein